MAQAAIIPQFSDPLCLCSRPTNDFPCSFFGAMFGSTAGLARSHKHFHSPPIQLEVVWAQGLPRVLRRVVLGLLVVVAAKEASRALFLLALPPLYRFFPFQIRRLWQPPVHNLCPPSRIPDPKMRALPHNAAGKPWDVDVSDVRPLGGKKERLPASC